MNRVRAVGFSIGSKGYIGTGIDASLSTYNDFWEYDPITDSWTQKANLPGISRYGAVGFSIGLKGYIGTGADSLVNYLNDFWEYDPVSNYWIQKADFGGVERIGAVGFSIGNYGYIGTGYNYSSFSKNDFWEYSPTTNSWTQKSNFGGTQRFSATGFSIANKGYMGTGYDSSGVTNDFWEFDPSFNSWVQIANFGGLPRSWATAFAIGTNGYVGTGGYPTYYNDFWEYDPATNLWSQKANFGGSTRWGASGFSIGNNGYIGTGSTSISGNYLKDFWEYVPDSTLVIIPIVSVLSSDTSFCEKRCIDFYDLSTNNPTSWQWFFPGADSLTSTEQNPTNICYSNYGSFDITLIACNAAGCDTLVLTNFINEYPAPTPTITQSNDTLFSSPGIAYQWWSVDSGIIAGATNFYYIPTQGGSYYVIVTDTAGCEGASNTIIVTGITPLSLGERLGVRCVPNPNKGSFTISLTSSITKDFSIRIINPFDQTISYRQQLIGNLQNSVDVNMETVAKGLYMVEVINGGKVYRGKFLKE